MVFHYENLLLAGCNRWFINQLIINTTCFTLTASATDQTALPALGLYVNVLMMFVHIDKLLLKHAVVLHISRMECVEIVRKL